jgi:hypothetical protein
MDCETGDTVAGEQSIDVGAGSCPIAICSRTVYRTQDLTPYATINCGMADMATLRLRSRSDTGSRREL